MTANRNERCAIQIEPARTITLAPETNAEYLNEQEPADYREYRREFVQRLRREGKDPKAYEGYPDYTAYETSYRTLIFDYCLSNTLSLSYFEAAMYLIFTESLCYKNSELGKHILRYFDKELERYSVVREDSVNVLDR